MMEEVNNDYKLPEGIRDPSLEFELLESLGRGSFGAVHKARYKKNGNIYAVKLVPVNEDFQEILKEINIMKQCKSKYIVQYFGNYFKDETCWIIMEYCALGSISDMMNVTDNILNEEQIALVCYSTLQGLYYLHKNSKIHRDIKPGNILVTASGECKLADFGVSGQLSERTRKRNTVIGTPFFLAPEVIQEEGYDHKADIWALGITAIEMAEFNPPYYDLHPMRVLFMIPTSPSPTLKNPSQWSIEFSDFLKLCLAKEQSQRPSAKDLLKHPFFEKKLRGTYVMKSLADTANQMIENVGGREQAVKLAAERKAKRSGSPNFKQADRVDDPNDSDEEDLLEKNNRLQQQSQQQSQQQQQQQNSSTRSPPPQGNIKNDNSLNELDSLLNGIILSSNNNNTNNNNNNINNNTANNNNNNNNRSYTNGNQQIQPQQQQQQQQINNRGSGEIKTSPIQSSMNFNRQLSNNSIPTSPNTVPKQPIEQKPKPQASELDDLLEEMLNPSFGNKPRGLTPISSPVPPKRISTNFTTTTPPVPTIPQNIRVSGVWKGETAGGCANTSGWRKNPQYLLQVQGTSPSTVRIALRQTGEKLVHIGFYFARANLSPNDIQKKRILLTTEFLVPGIDITFLRNTEVSAKVTVEPGNYIIIPATFEPNQESSFELELTPADANLKLTEIQRERDWRIIQSGFEWRGETAGGSFSGSSATWKDNPKFHFECLAPQSNITLVLSKHSDIPKETYIGFYIFKTSPDKQICPYIYLTAGNLFAKTNFLNGHEVIHTQQFPAGNYIIVPCTYDAKQEGSFTVTCYSDQSIQKLELSDKITTIRDEWKGLSSGGCLNHTTWRNNPQYLISNTSSTSATKITIMLEQLEKVDNQTLPFVGFYVARAPAFNQNKKVYSLTPKDIVGNTEFINDYQVHFTTILEPLTSYIVIPSSFTPGVEYPFNFRVASSLQSTTIQKLPDWYQKKLIGEWKGSSCGGRYSNTSSSWTLNPRFNFNLLRSSGGRFVIILSQSDKPTYNGIGFYYFKTLPDGTMKELIVKSGFVCGKEIVVEGSATEFLNGIVLPATFEPGIPDTFNLTVYSENEFEFNS